MLTTPGQLVVNAALPEEVRDYSRTMGQSEINEVLARVARDYPERYREISWRLAQLGRNAAFDEGSTITLNDLVPVMDKRPIVDTVRAQERAIRNDRRLSPEQRDEAIEKLYSTATKQITDETYRSALARNNPFALQAKYKARGNPAQLGAMLTSPGTYTDGDGKTVPIFISRSFAEGLRPHEYWAASYGARLGVTCLTPDTEVRMADGSVRAIGALAPGDEVLGADRSGKTYPVRVVRFYDNGVQPVYRWSFGNEQGDTAFVDATEAHKLLAVRTSAGTEMPQDPAPLRLDVAVSDDSLHVRSYFVLMSEDDGGSRLELLSRSFLGFTRVVDIEVGSDDHLFVLANGIVSSNSTKLGTQKGGYLSKMLNAASIDQVVTEDDCGTRNGIPVSVDDPDNVGSVLQSEIAGFKPGTVITKSVLDRIRESGEDEIVVRSPITCGCKTGLCKRCVGIRETGRFPDIGYNAGVNAASALGERIAQNSLNCLAEGTLVRMADGSTKPIETVNPGEYVLGSDLLGNIAPTRVVARYDNGIQPCVDTKFIVNGTHHTGSGIHLLSTTEHPILGTRFVAGQTEAALNWVPRILKVGLKSNRFFAYGPSHFDDTGFTHEQLALLLGALVGDDCHTESGDGVCLSFRDESAAADINESLVGSDVRLNRLKDPDGSYYRVVAVGERGSKRENAVKDYLVANGMYGRHAHDKDVPPELWGWDNASVAAFISGFIATGGRVYPGDGRRKSSISFVSTSRRLLENLRDLMLVRFGVLSSEVTIPEKAGTCRRKHERYQTTVTKTRDVRRLASVIRIPGVKKHRLSAVVSETAASRRYTRSAFRRVAQEDVGIRHVYDLEVECPDHIYLLANGLIVHNTKHSGKRSDLGAYVGFDALKNVTTIPKAYDVKASVTPSDGAVASIEPAPQGGSYVQLDDGETRIYVPGNLKPSVVVGDRLEAGDAVSDGLVSPEDVVAYKGIGDGRRYFMKAFTGIFKNSGYGVNRRNVEVLSRALINNVQVENPDAEGDALPGDVVRYSAWAGGYVPREGAERLPLDKADGYYLEEPYLHYTIGTRVTPSVRRTLGRHGYSDVLANRTAPGVVPHMVSAVEAPAYSGDWMARLGTSYLKSRLLEDAQVGAHSELHGTNPIPGMAKGVEFGNDMKTKGVY